MCGCGAGSQRPTAAAPIYPETSFHGAIINDFGSYNANFGHFLIRRVKNGHLDNQKVSEKIQHMAEKLSLRYVEIRGLF